MSLHYIVFALRHTTGMQHFVHNNNDNTVINGFDTLKQLAIVENTFYT